MASTFAVLSLALLGASCDKKSVAQSTPDPGPAVPFEAPPTGKPTDAKPPVAKPAAPEKPENLTPEQRVAALEDKLPSPCGKAHSLKKSLESDPSCKRSPFAKKYIDRLVKLELSDGEITDVYKARWSKEAYTFDTNDAPSLGTPGAPIVLVEFFDYGCPHCAAKAPVIAGFVESHPRDVCLYFKNFPLDGHKDSVPCAKAAVAAFRQGKFEEMHMKLFSNQGSQSKEDIFGYAKALGLDMQKFEADYNDPATLAKIQADKTEGERAKLEGTPTIYFNGRKYSDPITPEDMSDWVTEELASR